jgi:hypothetical protein
MVLRKFRDRFLINNPIGKAFVNLYYTYSPPVAKIIAGNAFLRFIIRLGLLPMVGFSWAMLTFSPAAALILAVLFIAGVIAGVVTFSGVGSRGRTKLTTF